MTLGEFRQLTKDLPNDTPVDFEEESGMIGLEDPRAEVRTHHGRTAVVITLGEH